MGGSRQLEGASRRTPRVAAVTIVVAVALVMGVTWWMGRQVTVQPRPPEEALAIGMPAATGLGAPQLASFGIEGDQLWLELFDADHVLTRAAARTRDGRQWELLDCDRDIGAGPYWPREVAFAVTKRDAHHRRGGRVYLRRGAYWDIAAELPLEVDDWVLHPAGPFVVAIGTRIDGGGDVAVRSTDEGSSFTPPVSLWTKPSAYIATVSPRDGAVTAVGLERQGPHLSLEHVRIGPGFDEPEVVTISPSHEVRGSRLQDCRDAQVHWLLVGDDWLLHSADERATWTTVEGFVPTSQPGDVALFCGGGTAIVLWRGEVEVSRVETRWWRCRAHDCSGPATLAAVDAKRAAVEVTPEGAEILLALRTGDAVAFELAGSDAPREMGPVQIHGSTDDAPVWRWRDRFHVVGVFE